MPPGMRMLYGMGRTWLAMVEVLAMYRERSPGGLEMANALRVAALLKDAAGDRAAGAELWREALPLYRAAGVPAGAAEAEKRLRAR